jgi:hypothetical protein
MTKLAKKARNEGYIVKKTGLQILFFSDWVNLCRYAAVRQAAAGEGAVTALVRTAPRVLCYATQRGGLHGWDLRSPGEAYRVCFPPQLGGALYTLNAVDP